jgi:hypothetical protein
VYAPHRAFVSGSPGGTLFSDECGQQRTENWRGNILFPSPTVICAIDVEVFVVGANPLFGFVAGAAGISVTLLLTIGICFFDKKFIQDYQTL